ncbi:hypothetical protein D3C80_1530500 [compost metagenome]
MQLDVQAGARVDFLALRGASRGFGEQVKIAFGKLHLGLRAACVGIEQRQRGLEHVRQLECFMDDQWGESTLGIGQCDHRDEFARRHLQLQAGLVAVAAQVAGNGLTTGYRHEVAAQLPTLELQL